MTRSARRSLAIASLGALVIVASGLEIRCDGANAQSRTTIASLQAEIDLLGLKVAMLEASGSGFELKGFTTTTVRGDSGVLVMTSRCAEAFPGSRMCTSREVLETRNVPTISSNNDAWVRPNFTSVATGGSANTVALDESGVPTISSSVTGTAEDMSCRGWIATANQGLVVSRNGSFRLNSCGNNRPVACCGP